MNLTTCHSHQDSICHYSHCKYLDNQRGYENRSLFIAYSDDGRSEHYLYSQSKIKINTPILGLCALHSERNKRLDALNDLRSRYGPVWNENSYACSSGAIDAY